jgi:hypothetical protein
MAIYEPNILTDLLAADWQKHKTLGFSCLALDHVSPCTIGHIGNSSYIIYMDLRTQTWKYKLFCCWWPQTFYNHVIITIIIIIIVCYMYIKMFI